MKLQELAFQLHLNPKDLLNGSVKILGKKMSLNLELTWKDELKIRRYFKTQQAKKAILKGRLRKEIGKNNKLIKTSSAQKQAVIESTSHVNKKIEISSIEEEKKSITPQTSDKKQVKSFLYKRPLATPSIIQKKPEESAQKKEKKRIKNFTQEKPKEKLDSYKKKKPTQNQKLFKRNNLKKFNEDRSDKSYKKVFSNKKKREPRKVHTFHSRKKVLVFHSAMSVSDFSKLIGKKSQDIQKILKQILDVDTNIITVETAELIAEELKVKIEVKVSSVSGELDNQQGNLEKRPPIVTIMGHVDHGKTSLLDCIRGSSIVDKEAGNITQRIGAYGVDAPQGRITFLDTPGHEAFSSMRARGSHTTDIVVLVVAVDDGVKPQTIEAIQHAKLAKVPVIVALTKCDKENSDIKKVIESLMQYELIAEKYGGNTIVVEVSSKTKKGISELLDIILLQAENMNLQARKSGFAKGVVIESRLEKKIGNIVSLLVQNGNLKQGDHIFSDQFYGKIRSMSDENGKILKEAFPSQPVEVLGFSGVPPAGSVFQVASEKIAKIMVEKKISDKKIVISEQKSFNLEESFFAASIKQCHFIVKTDTHGSLEAIRQLVDKIKNEQVKAKIVFSSVGAINKSDIHLAITTGATVIGFHVRPEKDAKEIAEKEGIEIVIYDIIYELIDKIKLSVEGLLRPILQQELQGKAQVLNTFNIPKIGLIAGCKVLEGKIIKNSILKIIRKDNLIHEGKLYSLKHLKSDVEKIEQGEECGLTIQSYKNFQVDDIIECYTQKEKKAQL